MKKTIVFMNTAAHATLVILISLFFAACEMNLMIFFRLVSLVVDALNWTTATFIDFVFIMRIKELRNSNSFRLP